MKICLKIFILVFVVSQKNKVINEFITPEEEELELEL